MTFETSATLTVEWVSFNLYSTRTIRLELWRNASFFSLVEARVPNSGAFDWSVGAGATAIPSGTYQLRISSFEEPAFANLSDSFALVNASAVRDPFAGFSRRGPIATDAYPFNTWWKGVRHQSLYLGSQLLQTNTSLMLSGLQIDLLRPSVPLSNFSVRFGFTSLTQLSSSFLSAPTLVHGPRNVSLAELPVNGSFFVNFSSTPVAWPRGQNLVVEIFHQSSLLSGGGAFRVNGAPLGRALTWASDSWGAYPGGNSSATVNLADMPMSVRFIVSSRNSGLGCARVSVQQQPLSFQWTRLSGSSDARSDCLRSDLPTCRSGASMVVFMENATLSRSTAVVFGGELRSFLTTEYVNDVWFFRSWLSDPAARWVQVRASNCAGTQVPKCRSYHSAALVGSRMIITGGGSDSLLFGDVWAFHLNNFTWSLLGTVRFAWFQGVATNGVDLLWLFGGEGVSLDDRTITSSQLVQFNVTSRTATLLGVAAVNPAVPGNSANGSSVFCLNNTALLPCLYAPALAFLKGDSPGSDALFVFGGLSIPLAGPSELSNAVLRFNLTSQTWTTVYTSNCTDPSRPLCRLRLASTTVQFPDSSTHLVVHGGVVELPNGDLDSANDVWTMRLDPSPTTGCASSLPTALI